MELAQWVSMYYVVNNLCSWINLNYFQCVLKVMCGWLMEAITYKDVLKSVTTMHGALSVMMDGLLLMHQLCVDNWDIPLPVYNYNFSITCSSIININLL